MPGTESDDARQRHTEGERLFLCGKEWVAVHRSSRFYQQTWYDPGSRQTRRRSLDTTDFELACRRLTERVLGSGTPANEAPESAAVSVVLARYWHGRIAKLGPATVRSRKPSLKYLSAFFADDTVATLSVGRQEAFIDWCRKERGNKDTAINRHLVFLAAALRWCRDREHLIAIPRIIKPWQRGEKPSSEPKGRPLSLDEMAALFNACRSEHFWRYLILAIGTAQRPGHICALTGGQYDRDFGLIDFLPPGASQSKKRRTIIKACPTLKAWCDTFEPRGAWIAYHGKPAKGVDDSFATTRDLAGLKDRVNGYAIRHTMGRWMRSRRVPADQISLFLGHLPVDAVDTTLTYSPYDPDYCQQAVDSIEAYFAELAPKVERHLLLGRPIVRRKKGGKPALRLVRV